MRFEIYVCLESNLHRVVKVFGSTLFQGLFISVPWDKDGHGSQSYPFHPWPGARTGHYPAGHQHRLRIDIQRKGSTLKNRCDCRCGCSHVVVHGCTCCFFSLVVFIRVSLFAATSPCRRLGSPSTRVTDITRDTYKETLGLCRVVVAHGWVRLLGKSPRLRIAWRSCRRGLQGLTEQDEVLIVHIKKCMYEYNTRSYV